MAPWQDAVAVQDFGPAYDRYGSFTTDAVEATRACLSAVARKRTNGPTSWDVRFVPAAGIGQRHPVKLVGTYTFVQERSFVKLFDHALRTCEQGIRNNNA
jgi:hypothetical protein